MILHKLIFHHLKKGDDAEFYRIQARDSIRWLIAKKVVIDSKTACLDLGCGHGIFGETLRKRGSRVTYADRCFGEEKAKMPQPFIAVDLDHDEIEMLGVYDLVVCSNVLEHLSDPDRFLQKCPSLLKPNGYLYLSWTNWLSPWGGHDFSPFHYFGPKIGHKIFDFLVGKKRIHTPFETLYPTSIGQVMKMIKCVKGISICQSIPRYYPELAFLVKIPFLREFLTWNCALLLRRNDLDDSKKLRHIKVI